MSDKKQFWGEEQMKSLEKVAESMRVARLEHLAELVWERDRLEERIKEALEDIWPK